MDHAPAKSPFKKSSPFGSVLTWLGSSVLFASTLFARQIAARLGLGADQVSSVLIGGLFIGLMFVVLGRVLSSRGIRSMENRRVVPVIGTWVTDAFWQAGIVNSVLEKLQAGRMVMMVCHFSQTQGQMKAALEAAGIIPFEPRSMGELDPRAVAEKAQSGLVWLLAAEMLPQVAAGAGAPQSGRTAISIIVPELHPIFGPDELILDYACALPCSCALDLHTSFESPFLQRAERADRMRSALAKMGIQEDECLRHSMLTNTFRRLQAENLRHARSNESAVSMADWFQRNG